MTNPYASPEVAQTRQSTDSANPKPTRDLRSFFAWYLGAFILAQLLWHLSAFVRAFDFLEVPMAAIMFPLAGFLDPHDGMVNARAAFFYAVGFWAATAPVALLLTPRRINPLLSAFAIIGLCAAASIVYALFVVETTGPVSLQT